jgi:hypothetical protein
VDVQVEVLEVVLAGTTDADVGHETPVTRRLRGMRRAGPNIVESAGGGSRRRPFDVVPSSS